MTSIRKIRKKAIRKMGFRMSFRFSHKDLRIYAQVQLGRIHPTEATTILSFDLQYNHVLFLKDV